MLAALALLGIGTGSLDVAMNADAVLVEARYGRPIMSSCHGMFSLGGLAGAALAGGAMRGGLPPVALLATTAAALGTAVLAGAPADRGRGRTPVRAAAPPADLARPGRGDRAHGRGRDGRLVGGLPPDGPGRDREHRGVRFAAFSLAMAIGRLTGDRVVGRFGPAGVPSRVP